MSAGGGAGAGARGEGGQTRAGASHCPPVPPRYSAEAQALDHKCSCCKEQRTSRRTVELRCPDGSSRSHTYTHIESCRCQDTLCELPPRRARRAASLGRR